MALPTPARRPERVFPPAMFVAFAVAIGLMALIVQAEISLPSIVLITVLVGGSFVLFGTGLMRPEVPLLVLTAYVPFSKVLVGDFGGLATALNLTNILMGVAIIGYVLRSMSARRPLIARSPLNFPIFLFCALSAISLHQGVAAGYSDDYAFQFVLSLKRWLTPILLYFLAYNIVRDKLTIKRLVVIMMLVVTMAGLMAIKDYIDVGAGSSLEKSRVGGIAGQPNQLGAFFVYYMFLFPAFPMTMTRKRATWWLFVPFLICLRAIQVTFSRGALLAAAFGGVAFAFFRSKALWLLVLMSLIGAVANPWLLPEGIRYRIESTFQSHKVYDPYAEAGLAESLDTSAHNRLLIWGGAVRMIQDHPFGVGYGAFPHLIRSYAPELRKRIDAHNSYLIIGAEMGLQTLAVFLWIVLIMFVKTHWLYRNAKDPFLKALALGWLGGLAGLLLANMFGSRLHSEEISAYFWIMAGLIMRGIAFERQDAAEAAPARVSKARRVRIA